MDAMKQTIAVQTTAKEELENCIDQQKRDHQMELLHIRVEVLD